MQFENEAISTTKNGMKLKLHELTRQNKHYQLIPLPIKSSVKTYGVQLQPSLFQNTVGRVKWRGKDLLSNLTAQ